MALKNWTVKTKQIKKKSDGLIKHFNYLFNKKRASHFYSEIVDLNNSKSMLNNILQEIDNRKEYRIENGLRGGGVSNLATSFVVSIPRDIKQPTNQEWKDIAAITLKQLANDIEVPFEKIARRSVIVLHDESNSPSKSSHLHILVSNIIDGQVVKPISQYQGTHSMKKGINKAVKHVLGEDHKNYMPKNKNVGDKPLFVKRDEDYQNKRNALMQDYEKRKEDLIVEKEEIQAERSAFEKSINFAKSILLNWIKALGTKRSNAQKSELEQHAKSTAKVIVDLKYYLPEVADEFLELARTEENRHDERELESLREETKVTYQVEKAQKKKRKRRTRNR